METENYKIEEYRNLYNEIHASTNRNAVVVSLIYTVSTGLIAFGLKSEEESSSELIFLTPLLLIIPLIMFIHSQLNGIARVASYIKVFHEHENNGLQWESRLMRYKRPKSLRSSKHIQSLFLMAISISSICLMLTFFNISDSATSIFKEVKSSTYIIAGFLLTMLSLSLMLLSKARNKYPKMYREAWEKLKKEEQNIVLDEQIDSEQQDN